VYSLDSVTIGLYLFCGFWQV